MSNEHKPMTDRLIGKREIAAMLGTSPGVAAVILEEGPCLHIHFFCAPKN